MNFYTFISVVHFVIIIILEKKISTMLCVFFFYSITDNIPKQVKRINYSYINEHAYDGYILKYIPPRKVGILSEAN